jgi:uncharacterized lipoprotein YmbA
MMRPFVAFLALLASGCAAERAMPVRYDLDTPHVRLQHAPRFDATIAIPTIQAPSWLRTTALIYRLDYEPPVHPRAYAQSQWAAPPNELLSLRLRERISADNGGFTIKRLSEDNDGYRLQVTLEDFTQTFASPERSQCVVTLSVLLQRGKRMLAQHTFHADFEQIVAWLRTTLAAQRAAGSPTSQHASY